MDVCNVENFCISVSLYTKAVILTECTGGVAVCLFHYKSCTSCTSEIILKNSKYKLHMQI